MATTYELITSQVFTGSAASVDFNSIPQTYKDFVLKGSVQCGSANATQFSLSINGSTTSIYSLDVEAVGSTLYANNGTSTMGAVPGSDAGSNSFGLIEFYMPNYVSTVFQKQGRFTYKAEYAATNAYVGDIGVLFSTTSAITSFSISVSGNIIAKSKFYLYGIKNS